MICASNDLAVPLATDERTYLLDEGEPHPQSPGASGQRLRQHTLGGIPRTGDACCPWSTQSGRRVHLPGGLRRDAVYPGELQELLRSLQFLPKLGCCQPGLRALKNPEQGFTSVHAPQGATSLQNKIDATISRQSIPQSYPHKIQIIIP